jgi:hypothetical protein
VLCPAEDLLARAATDPEVEQQLIKRMRGLLAPFVLRRLKSELAEQMVTKNHKLHEVCAERFLFLFLFLLFVSFVPGVAACVLASSSGAVLLLLCVGSCG